MKIKREDMVEKVIYTCLNKGVVFEARALIADMLLAKEVKLTEDLAPVDVDGRISTVVNSMELSLYFIEKYGIEKFNEAEKDGFTTVTTPKDFTRPSEGHFKIIKI